MIQSVTRALEMLETIAHAGGAASLGEVAGRAGLKTTTAHNILRTLQDAGYIRRRPGNMRYHLGDRILNLARVVGDKRCPAQPVAPRSGRDGSPNQ